MSYISRYDKGNWIALCDVCGRKYKASLLKKRWDGLMCCDDDWEIRQPQDFVRGVADLQAPKWARPEQSDHFIWSETDLSDSVGITETLTFKIVSSSSLNGSAINVSGLNK